MGRPGQDLSAKSAPNKVQAAHDLFQHCLVALSAELIVSMY